MTIIELRSEITKKMIRIPTFIDTTSNMDYTIWNNMRYVSDILLQLVVDKIIKQSTIENITKQYDLELEMIGDVTEKIFIIQEYYELFLEHILKRCLEEERFEAAANIRNFITTYKNKYQF